MRTLDSVLFRMLEAPLAVCAILGSTTVLGLWVSTSEDKEQAVVIHQTVAAAIPHDTRRRGAIMRPIRRHEKKEVCILRVPG